jgi:methionine-gamma-lyase
MYNTLTNLNILPVITDLRILDGVEDLVKSDRAIKMLYLETPANPTIQCVDIEALTQIAKRHNLIVACDNTFATPYCSSLFSTVWIS